MTWPDAWFYLMHAGLLVSLAAHAWGCRRDRGPVVVAPADPLGPDPVTPADVLREARRFARRRQLAAAREYVPEGPAISLTRAE